MSLYNFNFVEFVENCGGMGFCVLMCSDLEVVICKVLVYNGFVFVEVLMDVEFI